MALARETNTHTHTEPDTTILAYWLTWKVLLCSVILVFSVGLAVYLIRRYEVQLVERQRVSRFDRANDDQVLFDEDCWHCCWNIIPPFWFMIWRLVCFFCVFFPIVVDFSGQGKRYFLFYNQWSFIMSSIYFALASVKSIYGCYQYHCNDGRNRTISMEELAEIPDRLNDGERDAIRNQGRARPAAGIWGYILQIIYQLQAGAVVLSAVAYWCLNAPRIGTRFSILDFSGVWMHSVYPFLVVVDSASNSLGFPFFRIAYFLLWSCAYAIFHWILHACISTPWPFFLLNLVSPLAPVWYLMALFLHIPCYGIFWLVVKLKKKVPLLR